MDIRKGIFNPTVLLHGESVRTECLCVVIICKREPARTRSVQVYFWCASFIHVRAFSICLGRYGVSSIRTKSTHNSHYNTSSRISTRAVHRLPSVLSFGALKLILRHGSAILLGTRAEHRLSMLWAHRRCTARVKIREEASGTSPPTLYRDHSK